MSKNTCTHCGQPSIPENYQEGSITKIMTEKHLCFNCAFWHWQHDLDSNDPARQGNVAVIDGNHYVLGPDNNVNWPSGFCGARFYIRFNDGREVSTNNLWGQGKIPTHLRHLFPDNAVFVE